ncbi:MAG: hypothetical protein LN413_01065 [Candidatus Thermoplasmatota archaeon]|nr:hypothetical protein [Candidatus Thermoplasmatota archaeon]
MRVAKWPFKTFQENIEKAKALIIAQDYLNRMMEEGPDQVFPGFFAEWMGVFRDLIGFDVVASVEKLAKSELAEELQSAFAKPDEEKVQAYVGRMQELAAPIVSVFTLRGQTLLEQAVVLGVTGYETYVHDTARTILNLNSKRFDRFGPELNESLDWVELKKHGKDWKEAATTLIVERYKAFNLNRVKRLFRRLADIDNIFATEKMEKSIRKFIEHRHIIVHRAGEIDRPFKEVTGVRQPLGTVVKLAPSYVTNGLGLLSSFVGKAQATLEAQ